jgi:hypothetical protein
MPVLLEGQSAVGTSPSPNVGDGKSIVIHVCSASTSDATVKIQQSLGGDKWHTVATITNPTLEGELWRGPSLPLTRVYVSAWTSGSISAFYDFPSGAEASSWAQVDATTPTSGTFGVITKSWTNADVILGTGATTYNWFVGTLPAKSQMLSAYVTVDTQATLAAGTLKAGVGVAGTTYVDWVVSSDIKAAAATLYGNAAAERGTDAAIQYYTTAKPIYTQFIAGAGDLVDVTGSTGTVRILYVTYPA